MADSKNANGVEQCAAVCIVKMHRSHFQPLRGELESGAAHGDSGTAHGDSGNVPLAASVAEVRMN